MATIDFLKELRPEVKTLIAIINDTLASILCFYLALALRFGDWQLQVLDAPLLLLFFIVILVQTITFFTFGLYRGVWRYSSIPDLIRVIKAVSFAIVLSAMAVFFLNRLEGLPRTVFAIDWFLLVVVLGGARFTFRILSQDIDFTKNDNLDGAIIYGVGPQAIQLLREINSSMPNIQVRAFFEAGKKHKGKLLHGIPVYFGDHKISELADSLNIKKLFIAIPNASADLLQSIVKNCEKNEIEIKKIPSLKEFFEKKSFLSQLRRLEPEDLLGRKQVVLDSSTVEEMLSGRKVLVTGAGGSIGSELCRQIALFRPKCMILFEQSEFNLYALEQEFQEKFPEVRVFTVIGDVRNRSLVENAFKIYSPEIVLHAAAYKHVPLMEMNPSQSVNTNILGTKIVSEVAGEYSANRFVLVSTDKAINPTNIMGATKRIAEMVCQNSQASNPGTKYMIVRFGNVLGSSGSVIPKFKKQIQNGGPITVTHPDIQRYFMSIPEASRLVLQAGAIGSGGEIFVLDMGEPVKIVDLARQMIALAGLRADHDIKIQFTGLRPGEKLFEELLIAEESILPTIHPLVKVAKSRELEADFPELLEQLLTIDPQTTPYVYRNELKKLVSEYTPKNTEAIDQLFEEELGPSVKAEKGQTTLQ
jgi:FlaA1/EpsC-like NDP-sugar epimerase